MDAHIPQSKEGKLAEALADLVALALWDDRKNNPETQEIAEFASLLRYKLDRLMGYE